MASIKSTLISLQQHVAALPTRDEWAMLSNDIRVLRQQMKHVINSPSMHTESNTEYNAIT